MYVIMSDLDALFDNVSKSLIGILDMVAIHSKVHNTVSIDIGTDIIVSSYT